MPYSHIFFNLHLETKAGTGTWAWLGTRLHQLTLLFQRPLPPDTALFSPLVTLAQDREGSPRDPPTQDAWLCLLECSCQLDRCPEHREDQSTCIHSVNVHVHLEDVCMNNEGYLHVLAVRLGDLPALAVSECHLLLVRVPALLLADQSLSLGPLWLFYSDSRVQPE